MEKQEARQAEIVARRKRIALYKKIVIYTVLVLTVFPIISGVLLLDKVGKLEKRLAVLVAQDMDTLMDSAGAFTDNPNATVESADSTEAADTDEEDLAALVKENEGKRVYLTFDDGPSFNTGEILDILKTNGVKATFFVIGREDERYHAYYKRIVDEGHTLAMHSFSHNYKEIYDSPEAFKKDITKLSNLLYDITGFRPNVYRFPGGSSNTIVNSVEPYITCLNDMGLTYYDWNALNGDAVSKELSAKQLVENVMRSVRKNNTSVVLMHDLQTRHATVESLQDLIDILKEEGYTLLPIDESTPLVQHVKVEDIQEEE